MTEINFNLFRKGYVEQLSRCRTLDPENYPGPYLLSPEGTVDKMLAAINKDKGRSDWLAYNPALKAAAKAIGITKSKEFREYVWANYVAPVEETS